MACRPSPIVARVRMYRQGSGDCSLLTLSCPSRGAVHVLLDCGVLLGSPAAVPTMARIAGDIASATGGHLDIITVTNENWEHLSGFLQARSVFDEMTIGEIWLPWTEDPADDQAVSLRRERHRIVRGLRVLAGRLAGIDAPAAERLRRLLGRFGTASGPGPGEAFDYLTHHPSRPHVRYLALDDASLELAGLDGVRAYILGPPRAESAPGRNGTARVNLGEDVFAAGVLLLAAVGGVLAGDEENAERCQAFEDRYRLPTGRAEGHPFFRNHYLRPRDAWRRIDSDWLSTAETLALALDDHTNQSSLALAFELEPAGRVLLFPGDVQLGGGRPWANRRWLPDPATNRRVTAADLLSRTVLYKVGQYTTINATTPKKELESMTSPGLVAMISGSQTIAERMGWNRSPPTSLERLLQKARGRVLRADVGMPDRPDDIAAAEWAMFTRRIEVDRGGLYIDLIVE